MRPPVVLQHLGTLRERGVAAVLLSTCHRTELYWWGDEELAPWFESAALPAVGSRMTLERRDADLAVRHLFSVTAGMRSARYGEPEVQGQMRAAWIAARAAHVTNTLIDAVFRQAIEAARHIRLAIGDDADPALGARVREAIDARRGEMASPARLLVVGSGDAARGVLEALTASRASTPMPWLVTVTSRTDERAQRIANAFAASAVPWAERHAALHSADVIVFAAHATSPLVSSETAREITAHRQTPALWLDLGVPHNVEASDLPDTVEWVGIDTLAPQSRQNHARDRRANGALQRELARFAVAMHRRKVGARLSLLEERAVSAARAALAAGGDMRAPGDSADLLARQVTRLLLREFSALSA